MHAKETLKNIRKLLNNLGSYKYLNVDYILDVLFKYNCVILCKNVISKFILNILFTCNTIYCIIKSSEDNVRV